MPARNQGCQPIFRCLFGPAPKHRAQESGGIYTANFRRHLLWIFGGTPAEVGYGLTVVCCQTKLLVRSLHQLVRSKFLRRSSCPCRPVGGGEVKAGNRHRNSATDETRGCWLASHRGADLQPRCRWRLAAAGPAPQTSVPATRFRRWSVPGPFLFNMYHNGAEVNRGLQMPDRVGGRVPHSSAFCLSGTCSRRGCG